MGDGDDSVDNGFDCSSSADNSSKDDGIACYSSVKGYSTIHASEDDGDDELFEGGLMKSMKECGI
jgi:hypothetical protein